ncbi:MAG: type II toxin-antitoxin system HicA family toxin [Pseudonocardia sp.]|nr:type II toxin-antitoxin system HicA family toxin [Pseudonocardia sp.]
MKAREVNRKIERLGGRIVRQSGSHRRYRAEHTDTATGQMITCETLVAQHASRDIPMGTLRSIEKDLEPVYGKGWLR